MFSGFRQVNGGRRRVDHSTKYSQMVKKNYVIVNEDQSEQCICSGYLSTKAGQRLCVLLTVVTLGLIQLLWRWKPEWKLRLQASKCSLHIATHVLLKDEYQQTFVRRIQFIKLEGSYERCDDALCELQEVKTHQITPKLPQHLHPCDVDQLHTHVVRYFEFNFFKYIWKDGTFAKLMGEDWDSWSLKSSDLQVGLTPKQRSKRALFFGKNCIEVAVTGYVTLLFREVLNPFYMFQLFSVCVWGAQEYFAMCAAIASLSIISISISLYSTRKQSEVISAMSKGHGEVRSVGNDGKIVKIDSRNLVPGDIIELSREGGPLWADCMLLSGSCVVNESTLTGESTPVFKSAVSTTSNDVDGSLKQHTLLCGTKILFSNTSGDDDSKFVPPRARVLSTGFLTKRGQLVESIISPKPVDFKFYRDSICFIKIMAAIGLIGSIAVISILSYHGVKASSIVMKVLDLLTIIVPPGLPAALTVGTVIAQCRLKRKKIFCISPPRINISGKVDCMCFDKTGTITEDNFKMAAVIVRKQTTTPNDNTNGEDFHPQVKDCEQLLHFDHLGVHTIVAMATCHSLIELDGHVIGDPLEKILEQSVNQFVTKRNKIHSKNIQMDFPSNLHHYKMTSFTITKTHHFSPEKQRMSVVLRNESTGKFIAYSKGSPEVIHKTCTVESLPNSFHETLNTFTKKGFRVIALAYKEVDSCTMTRDDVESHMTFIGLVVLGNPLRSLALQTITELKNANIRTVMVTGDDLNTAIAVARKCNLATADDEIVEVQLRHSDDKYDEIIKVPTSHSDMKVTTKKTNAPRNLAITGNDFERLRDGSMEQYNKILAEADIFARMKPNQKMQLMCDLQNIGYTVGMCGDGANDCGALKQAHVGISLAEVEASIAAPFTSKLPGIECSTELIKEGRAALATSFGMIKYLCIYSFVQYLALIFMFSVLSYFNDGQFLLGDIGVTGVVTLFFGLGGAAVTLAPKPPQCALVSKLMLTTLLLHIVLIVLVQAMAFFTLGSQPWYIAGERNTSHIEDVVPSHTSTTMFYISTLQYVVLAWIFYSGKPHRQPIYKNYIYVCGLIFFMVITMVLLFAPFPPLDVWFNIAPLGDNVTFKFLLLACSAVHFVLAYGNEEYLSDSTKLRRFVDILLRPCIVLYENRKYKCGNHDYKSTLNRQRQLTVTCSMNT